jgi:ArsR family transcriptional regulator, arsenate/arsenite/antimonite-responsive transcriptional repressor
VEVSSVDRSPQGVVRVLAALAEVNRYRIMELLAAEDELSCGAIGRRLGLSPSLLSHHLHVLEEAGIIERRKDALWTLNRLRRAALCERLNGIQTLVSQQPVAAVT